MAKPKVIREEKYRAGAMLLKKGFFPTLHHIGGPFDVVSAEVKSAGVLSDGDEFQVIRVVLRPKEK